MVRNERRRRKGQGCGVVDEGRWGMTADVVGQEGVEAVVAAADADIGLLSVNISPSKQRMVINVP